MDFEPNNFFIEKQKLIILVIYQTVAFKIIAFYLLYSLIIQLRMSYLASLKENNLLYGHFYFIGQWVSQSVAKCSCENDMDKCPAPWGGQRGKGGKQGKQKNQNESWLKNYGIMF